MTWQELRSKYATSSPSSTQGTKMTWDQLKQKYANYTPTATVGSTLSPASKTQQSGVSQTLGSMFGPVANKIPGANDFGVGFAKSLGSTVKGIGQMGSDILDQTVGRGVNILSGKGNVPAKPISPVYDKNSDVSKKIEKALTPTNTAQKIGGVAETVGEIFAPIGEAADTRVGEKVVQGGKDILEKGLVGKEGMKTLEQIANDEAQKFANGKTFSDVVDTTQKAIDKFVSSSKSALHAVKQSIPKIAIDPSVIAQKVNDGIMSAVKGSAAYKGVGEEAVSMFKSPEDLIKSGLLDEGEAKKVKGMVNVIKDWSDNSARGVLNLKEQLGSFYKEGMDNSNAILRNIQNGLKDIVGEVAPEVKPALKAASDNIEKADEFTRNLIGRDSVSGESKLISIAKNLKNPATNAEKIGLIQDLEKATGQKIIPQLKGYADYLGLQAKDFPTKAGTILKEGSKRIGIGGGVVAAGAELKHLLGF